MDLLLFVVVVLYQLISLNPSAFREFDEGVDVECEAEGAVSYQYIKSVSLQV